MKKILLKVLSHNIHKGLSSGNLKFTLKRLRTAIHELNPDLVCLQEVQGHHTRHKKYLPDQPDISQFEYIAEGLWPHFSYGKNVIYTQGHHGNAILSRFPIQVSHNISISSNRFEKRGILHTVFNLSGHAQPLHVICIHLGLFEFDRAKQVSELCQRIESLVPHSDPLIVAGDFNDWREKVSKVLHKRVNLEEVFLLTQGSHAKTFPIWMPTLKVDRIYFRGLEVKAIQCLLKSPWNDLSDHAAMYSEFLL